MAGTNETQLRVPAFDILINGRRLTQTEKAYVAEFEVDVSVTLPSMKALASIVLLLSPPVSETFSIPVNLSIPNPPISEMLVNVKFTSPD